MWSAQKCWSNWSSWSHFLAWWKASSHPSLFFHPVSLVLTGREEQAGVAAGGGPALEDGSKLEDGPCHRKWSGGA